jgi:hypothetical protein
MLAKQVEDKSVGLPWQTWLNTEDRSESYSSFTPVSSQKQVNYMKRLIKDAISKGAKIMNEGRGDMINGLASTLMVPAILYPVTPNMDIARDSLVQSFPSPRMTPSILSLTMAEMEFMGTSLHLHVRLKDELGGHTFGPFSSIFGQKLSSFDSETLLQSPTTH